jgi:hypothetical protein
MGEILRSPLILFCNLLQIRGNYLDMLLQIRGKLIFYLLHTTVFLGNILKNMKKGTPQYKRFFEPFLSQKTIKCG